MISTMRTRRRHLTRLTAAAVVIGGLVLAGCAGGAARPTTQAPEPDAALRALLPADIRSTGVLTVATDASYAPATFFAPDGRSVVGFEPDLAAALGSLLGIRMEFVVTDFVDALAHVRTDRVDVAMTAMTDTGPRERQADFVNYFSAGTAVLVQRGNPHGVTEIEDLCGHVVAVERGTVQVDLLTRSQDRCGDRPIEIGRHKTNADALVELRTGRAAAVLNDYPPAAYLATDPRTQSHYQLASDTQYEPGLYGIAVAKDEPRLREALRAGLARLVETGDYARVLRQWDVSEGAVAVITVNAG